MNARVERRTAVAIAALVLPGCLASTYRIPPEELARQASLPPQERGRRVRVVQDVMFGGPSTPVPGDEETAHELAYLFFRVSTPTGSGGDDAAAVAVVIVVTAAVVTLGLMASEAIRYDGWVAMDPESLILLESPERPTATSLRDLSSSEAGSATDGYVHGGSAPEFEKLERAPLSRQGFTYALHAGTATGLAPEGGGLTMRPEFGYFPTERIGVKLAYEATFSPEIQHSLLLHLQWMFAPWVGAWIHGGRIGIADDAGPIGGGGVLLEIPATTRMAFEARAGASFVNLEGWGDTITSVTLGVAIY